jgi:lactate racemase
LESAIKISAKGGSVMADYYLNGHDGKVSFRVPETWRVVNNAILKAEKSDHPLYQLVSDAIAKPIGTLPLADLVKGKRSIVIIADDLARPTPKGEIVKCLVDHLHQFGLRNDQVHVLIGVGTHRPMTEAEIRETYGEQLSREIRFVNHDCQADDLVSVGTLRYGGELKIHPLAAKADLRIAIGSILPHPFAGFGGGAKLVLPGIANYDAIRRHHLALMVAPNVWIGNIKANPFRDDIWEAARLAHLDFIVNAVYDSDEDVKAVVAGDFDKAHTIGAAMCSDELGVPFDQAADITISSVFPYTEGPQIMKPVGPATMVTKKGGALIVYVSKIQGGRFPDSLLEAFDHALSLAGDNPRQLVMDSLREGKLIAPDAPMDFNSAINTALLYLSRVKIIMVSKDADEKQAAKLGCGYAGSLEQAISKVAKDVPEATVNILPSGGLILPLVAESMKFEW